MYLNVSVVLNEPEFPKAIHEEADPRSRGANHLGQGFLADTRNGGRGFTGFAELRQQ